MENVRFKDAMDTRTDADAPVWHQDRIEGGSQCQPEVLKRDRACGEVGGGRETTRA